MEKLLKDFQTQFMVKSLNPLEPQSSFIVLAKHLLEGKLVAEICLWFHSHLYVLLELTVEKDVVQSIEDHSVKLYCLLGELCNKDLVGKKFAWSYFTTHPPPFNLISEEPPPAKKKKSKMNYDFLVARSTYKLLICDKDIAYNWNWAPFLQYLSSSNAETKWYACETLSMVFNLSEIQRMEFHSGHTTRKEHIQFLLNTLEEKEIPPSENSSIVADISVIPSVLSIDGIELVVENTSVSRENCLVTVESTKEHLRSLALAIAKDSPILIQGIVGSGKTSLVDHLAMISGRYSTTKYTKIQLGDQTDSKVLVGTYRCTDIPGEFVWQPGVLAQAVAEGNWILLEDVDYASMDVISVLLPVLESRTLLLPGRGESIKAAPGFQIFLTQRLIAGSTGLYKQHLGHFHIIERYLRKVHVEPLSREELKIVLNTKYPVLTTVCDRLLEVYFFLVAGCRDSIDLNLKSRETRLVSTRDLLKWCKRMTEHFDVTSPTSQHNAFLDALDIFCGYFINNETRLPAAEMIGSRLNILKAKAEFYVNSHKPAVDINDKKINIGRVSLLIAPSNLLYKKSQNYTFSFTRQAAILLERVATSIKNNEPVLLVGETGCGKTTSVQYLANVTNHKLTVVNMNQQSDSADLVGGYKPVEIRHVVAPLRDAFEELFGQSFSLQENSKFLGHVMKTFCNHRWQDLFTLMLHSQKAAVKKFKYESDILKKWEELGIRIMQLKAQVKSLESTLAFAFVEGSLVKAVKNGDWILLDEINLASAETLECLSGLLEGEGSSLSLFEKGDRESLKIHPEFRLFACMNPATDVGKKDLPPGIRNRFTEFFVEDVTSEADLKILIGDYLRGLSITSTQIDGIVKFYQKIRREAVCALEDGTGHKPHYSLRTLCRALTIAATNMFGSVPRSIYEAFCLSFLTQLDRKSHPVVEGMIATQIMHKKNLKAITSQAIPKPSPGLYVEVENYWIEQGDRELLSPEEYVITPTVRANLRDIARIVSASRHPVLLQGETSVGKTSLIVYLAKLTGNTCVRVNNHEHTDIQEYLGSYTAGENGKLVFQEGVLVQAMRKGHWIILDELNLAPSDVLEALNRVLDENRELFITETQETVKAHPRFQIFATQNPPGQYGGRKVLSRAFRNRFVELHFDEIPANELETILNQRCQIPLSYAKKLVAVHKELQVHRRGSAAFAGKSGFVTLRDLFRWAERYRLSDVLPTKLYDWDQHMADEGYLVLSGKVRKTEERLIIQQALEKHMKRKVEEERLFWLSDDTSSVTKDILRETMSSPKGFEHIVWTFEMRRLAVLVGKSFKFKEPVLLVGDTGCGKTTICQLFAAQSAKHLYSVNCHQHSEAADFLGGLRPARNRNEEEGKLKLFEWVDGPLIHAMGGGHIFLADEISLADDSVLERLNSVLEPERSLLLAERGTEGQSTVDAVIEAQEGFRFVGTMNPGGDYGKKELSPALRNRFTEIWCPVSKKKEDLIAIIEHNLKEGIFLSNQEDGTTGIGKSMCDFIEWFSSQELGKRSTVSIRDILSWVSFINMVALPKKDGSSQILDVGSAYAHGGCLVFLDGLGTGTTSTERLSEPRALKKAAIELMSKQILRLSGQSIDTSSLIGDYRDVQIILNAEKFGISPFFIERGPAKAEQNLFKFKAPTTAINVARVLRSMQLSKPILLEGSPGVGKTSLVEAMSKVACYELVRINLSEQTDVADLFGADLPVEGGSGGQFAWRDGPLLQALKAGHWIVLDELNLASQSVLEGLNAVLDHRGELFIPELGRTFQLDPKKTKLFACQNPQREGGARKGLPKSFLNRFTQVYIEPLFASDLKFILNSLFPQLESVIDKMVEFNTRLQQEILERHQWGLKGGPWELNLRDMFRWSEAIVKGIKVGTDEASLNPGIYVKLIYADRMRTMQDKCKVLQVYEEVFGEKQLSLRSSRNIFSNKSFIQIGNAHLKKSQEIAETLQSKDLVLLHKDMEPLESLIHCVNMNWMAILVGPHAAGKTSLVKLLSQLAGCSLYVLPMNSSMDTTELLGGFEQTDLGRHLEEVVIDIKKCLHSQVQHNLIQKNYSAAASHLTNLQNYYDLLKNGSPRTVSEEVQSFKKKIEALKYVCRSLQDEILLERLEFLQKRIEMQKVITGGGSFEWVDSIFVKALKEGHWLLIDNVNFCGASVLDRLNALLEPNGKLVISERGIIDGKVPTVQPHKDFRLFLAMDPQNGEISRAMRNRGVEIYMLGPQEENPYTEVEIRALLNGRGLKNGVAQQLLIEFHTTVKEIVSEFEKPTVISILESACLVSQISRLRSFAESLRLACSDVYVRPQRNLFTKKKMKEALDTAYQSWTKTNFSETGLYDIIGSNYMLSGNTERKTSELSRVLQDSTILQLLTTVDNVFGFDLRTLSQFNEFALCHFFHEATYSDIQLRFDYVAKFVDIYYPLTRHLIGYLKSLGESEDIPLDSRLKYPLERHTKPEVGQSNRLFLWLQFSALKWRQELRLSNKKERNLYALITAINEGKISAESAPHPIISVISSLLSKTDSVLYKILMEETFLPTNEEFSDILKAIQWRFHFGEVLFEEITKSIDVVVSRIGQYWKWLDLNLLKQLRAMDSTSLCFTKDFEDDVQHFRASFGEQEEAEVEWNAKFLDRYGRPTPYKTINAAETADFVRSLSEKLSIPSPSRSSGDGAFEKKITFLLSDQGKAVSHQFVDLIIGSQPNIKDDLTNVADRIQDFYLMSQEEDSWTEIFNSKIVVQVQILPLQYLSFQLQLQRAIAQEKKVEIIGNLPYLLSCNLNRFLEKERPRNVVLYEFLKMITTSPLRRAAHFWVNYNGQQWMEQQGKREIGKNLTAYSPILSLTCGAQSLASTEELGKRLDNWDFGHSVHLSSYKAKIQHLTKLASSLWKNMPHLLSQEFNPRLNDARLALMSSKAVNDCTKFSSLAFEESSSIVLVKDIKSYPNMTNLIKTGEHYLSALASKIETYQHTNPLEVEPLCDSIEMEVLTARVWIQTGLIAMNFVSKLELVDPVERNKILVHLSGLELDAVNAQISIRRLDSLYKRGIDIDPSYPETHEYFLYFCRRQSILESLVKDLNEKIAVRPDSIMYENLKKELIQYISGIGSQSSIESMMIRLSEAIDEVKCGNTNQTDSTRLLLEVTSFLTSQQNFCQRMESNYSWYWDIVQPILCSVMQVIHGLQIMSSCLERIYKKREKFEKGVSNSVEYLIKEIGSFLPQNKTNYIVSLLLGKYENHGNFHEIIERAFGTTENSWVVNKLKRNILLSALIELKQRVYQEKQIELDTRNSLEEIFEHFVSAWNKSEEERRKKEEEKESLYRTKNYEGEPTDEEAVDYESIRRTFPTYIEHFEEKISMDVDSPTSNESAEVADELVNYIRPEDMSMVVETHLHLFRKFSENPFLKVPTLEEDCGDETESFRIRYESVSILIDELYPCLDQSLDRTLLISHVLALQLAASLPEQKRKNFNIYYDSHPEEAIRLRDLLDGLVIRIKELITEWPDHPVLNQIMTSINHILSFPISSPLMKLLTGLELSLGKCQEWEANAHRGVSLSVHLEALTTLVLDWRKMELHGWKLCLNSVERNVRLKSDKWWFHIYGVFLSFVGTGESGKISFDDISSTFRQFMETATIGDFSYRLEIVQAFLFQILTQKSCGNSEVDSQKDELVRSLWNIYFYFSQELPAVIHSIQSIRNPIERKVKEFVKIMRWNDINYWSAKDTVNKSHKTLHKFMKDYETALKESVQTLLSRPTESNNLGDEANGIWDVSQGVQNLTEKDLGIFIAPEVNITVEENTMMALNETETLIRLPKLYPKSRSIVRDIVSKSTVSEDIAVIDDLTGEVIKTVLDLQKLQTIGGEDKEKQLAEARQIHLRKRNGLAELFKVLQRLGLSYRKGLPSFVLEKSISTDLEVLDVQGSLTNLQMRSCDSFLLSLWTKCPVYHSRRTARFNSLKTHLLQPCKELGPAIVERIKGFSETIMKFDNSLWNQTASSFKEYVSLRRHIESLQDALANGLQSQSTELTNTYFKGILPASNELESLLSKMSVFLRVYKSEPETYFLLEEGSTADDKNFLEISQQINNELGHLKAAKDGCFQVFNLYRNMLAADETPVLNSKHFSAIESTFTTLMNVIKSISEVMKIEDECAGRNSFISPLKSLSTEVQRLHSSCQKLIESSVKSGKNLPLDSLSYVDKAVKSALIAIQETQKNEVSETDGDNELDYELNKDHLIDLVSRLKKAVSLLKVKELTSDIELIARSLNGASGMKWDSSLLLLMPIMDQFLRLVEFFIFHEMSMLRANLKLSSVLFGLFDLLAEKGFCLPTELSEDLMKEGSSEFEDIESGGLGDGEGAKDVSDQIENEDQLEGAKQKGEEKEEANEDVPEEEGGIEMSDDFEGKQQDVKPSEDGEKSDESEDEDLDKQMGETEKGQDKLDEEVWGDEDENETEQEEKKEEEGKGDGKDGESQTVAKEDAPEGNDEKDKDEPKNDKMEEKEINEFEEQNPDDDQIDPYHGQQGPEPEPEPFDLPDDLNIDAADQDDNNEEAPEDPAQETPEVQSKEIEDATETEESKELNAEEEKTQDDEIETDENPPEESPEGETNNPEIEGEEPEKTSEIADEENVESTQATASDDKSTETETQAAEVPSKGSADNVQMEADADAEQGGANEEDANKEAEGIGVSQVQQSAGHQGPTSAKVESQRLKQEQLEERIQKQPGLSDMKRSLADQAGNENKRLKTIENKQDKETNKDDSSLLEKTESEAYEHIWESEQQFDAETVDAATEEQAKERPVPREEGEKPADDEDMPMEEEKEEIVEDNALNQESEKVQGTKTSERRKTEDEKPSGTEPCEEHVEVEGEIVKTHGAPRGDSTEFFTNVNVEEDTQRLSQEDIDHLRLELENQLALWSEHRQWNEAHYSEAIEAWSKYEAVVNPLAQDLCEQLRLILEPSQASRLRGDYRTGKRLNMRKVIPYIASQFRKDKIWLRRTKPSKRQYQIVLAVDDSSSMADNHSKQLTFESLAMISKALSLVEAGELGVVSFGETTRLVHDLSEAFTSQSGGKLLHDLTFAQKKTRVGQMVNFVTANLLQCRSRLNSSSELAQLLVVLSDGRGIFSEGIEPVKQAIRRAKEASIFMVFVIIDNPENKDSILDIRQPVFEEGRLKEIRNYMDQFPFPYYLILRNINSLPVVLSDALRQWFELVTSQD